MFLLLSTDLNSVSEVNDLVFGHIVPDNFAFENFDVYSPLSFAEIRLKDVLEKI